MSNIYGDWLKQQREAAELTQQQLADMAIMTRSHIAHIEAGRRVPSKEDARRLDAALNTGDVLSSFLPEEEAAVADYFEAARHLERQAVSIQEFALSYMPGVLQTEEYMRAIIGTSFIPLSEEERDRLVVTRLERAKVFDTSGSPALWALLDEAVLRRVVGGPEVMAKQVTHLARLVERGRIRVHVLPQDIGFHPLMDGMLTLMRFEDQPPVAYTEGLGVGKLHDSPTVVREFETRYALALSDSMSLRDSLALLRDVAKDYGHHG